MSEPAWVVVGRVADIPPGHAARVEIDDVPVAIFNVAGEFFAIDDTCSHEEASLSEGDLIEDRCVIFFATSGPIDVFDTQQEQSSLALSGAPALECRIDMTEMQVAGRTRRKARHGSRRGK